MLFLREHDPLSVNALCYGMTSDGDVRYLVVSMPGAGVVIEHYSAKPYEFRET